MSAQFDSSTNDYMTSGANGTPITDTPFTISAWVKPADISGTRFATGLSADNANWAAIAVAGSTALPQAHIDAAGVNDAINGTTQMDNGAWHHILAVFSADNARELFVNGASQGTDASTRNPSAYTAIMLGRAVTGDLGGESAAYQGLLAHVAIYNAGLTVTEAAELAGGANPLAVASANLVAYYPLDTDFDITDHVGTYDLTNSGAAYSSDNPTVDPPPTDANEGDVDADAQAASLAAAGTRRSIGDSAAASQPATTTITGHKLLDGDLAMQAGASTLAASGGVGISGTVDLQAQASDVDAAGVRRTVDVGEGFGLQSQRATTTVTGTRRIVGTVGASSSPATASIQGPRLIPGTTSVQAQAAVHSSSGVRRVTGGAAQLSGGTTLGIAGTRRVTGTTAAAASVVTFAIIGARVRSGGLVMTNPIAPTLSITGDVGGQISGVLTPAANAALLAASGTRRVTGDIDDGLSMAATVAVDGVKSSDVSGDVAAQSQVAQTIYSGSYVNIGAASLQSALATFVIQQALAGYLVGTVRVIPALSATRVRTTPVES